MAQPPGVYGAPLPDRPEPSSVATDPPRESTATGEDRSPEVLVTWSGWDDGLGGIAVDGYVDVVESDGTCRLTVTNGVVTVTTTGEATADALSTSCAGLVVSSESLTPGRYEVRLEYTSPTTTVASDPLAVDVP
jgi:hypothetical protein